MMILDNKFDIGETVYIINDQDQLPRIITGMEISQKEIIYVLYQSTSLSRHFDFELAKEKQLVL